MNRIYPKIILIFIVSISYTSCFYAQIAQFGGPDRNGIYNETGLLDEWPDEGPELVRTISGIGDGYGSPAINEKGTFIAGMIDSIGYIFHFDHNGKLIWETQVGVEFNFKYVGSRGTPTIENDRLYYIASEGDAVCLDIASGKKIWHVNIMQKYDGQDIKWGYTESPLIYEDKVFFTPGGIGKNFVALDKMTGEEIWIADLDSTKNSYCSPVIINHNSKDYILLTSSNYILVLDPSNGDALVKHPLTNTRYNHAIPPLYNDGKLFYSSGYGEGTTLLKIRDGKKELDTLYRNTELDCKLSGLINYEGTIFGTSDKRRMWMGVDYQSGETLFTSRDFKAGSFILCDDKFYMFSDKGEVGLAKPSITGFDIISRFQVPAETVAYAFAIPVIYKGILYIRYNDNLWLYKIK